MGLPQVQSPFTHVNSITMKQTTRFTMMALLLGTTLFAQQAQAQIVAPSEDTKAEFMRRHPGAQGVDWKHEGKQFQADFKDAQGRSARAEYNLTGKWKMTETDITVESLPGSVRNGFRKSRFADWQIEAAEMLTMPGSIRRYRLKVGKGDLQKRFLTFENNGRLLKTSLTL